MLAVYQFLSCCNLPSLIIIDRSMKVATYYILYTISKHYVVSFTMFINNNIHLKLSSYYQTGKRDFSMGTF